MFSNIRIKSRKIIIPKQLTLKLRIDVSLIFNEYEVINSRCISLKQESLQLYIFKIKILILQKLQNKD